MGHPDIGSTERQAPGPYNLVVNTGENIVGGVGGTLSLADAIAFANASAGEDTITFAPWVTYVSGGILPITDNLKIVGPGSNKLTVANTSLLIDNHDPASQINVAISGLSLTFNSGVPTNVVAHENTTFDDVTFRNIGFEVLNSSPEVGAKVTLSNSSIIYGYVTVNGPGQTEINNATILGSTYLEGDASIYANGPLLLQNSTVVGGSRVSPTDAKTSVRITGGGIKGPAVINNSIVSFVSPGSTISHSLVIDGDSADLAEAPVGHPDAQGNLIGSAKGNGRLDPLFGELGTFGGIRPVLPLLAGSPAIVMTPDLTANTLVFPAAHNFREGQAVQYDVPSGSSAIGGLVAGQTYYVRNATNTTLSLSTTVSGPIIDLTEYGSGQNRLLRSIDVNPVNDIHVDIFSDRLIFASAHGLAELMTVKYNPAAGATPIGGLTAGENYLVHRVDDTTISLSPWWGPNSQIDLTATGAGQQTFTPQLQLHFSGENRAAGSVDVASDSLSFSSGHFLLSGRPGRISAEHVADWWFVGWDVLRDPRQ